jgi:translocator protein
MNNAYNWYQTLIKPSWAPPSWLFGPVWTILYIIIFISFGTVFYKVFTGKLPWLVALPFVLNLVFNFAFTTIQFRLKNNFLASIDVLLVLVTLIWAMISIYIFSLKLHIETGAPSLTWIALVNLPYLLWAGFATILQLTVTYLNR